MSVAPAAWAMVAGLCIFALVLPIAQQHTHTQLPYSFGQVPDQQPVGPSTGYGGFRV